MKKNIFDYRDYKAYLEAFIAQLPSRGHGFRVEMAKTLRIHNAYVSQVLNSSAHFSPEQAEDLNTLLGHTEDESEYFVLLVQIARAGTSRYKRRLQLQMDQVLQRRSNLKERVKIKNELTPEEQMRFYSSWHYTAVHILVTIPQFRTLENISNALRIPKEKTKQVLDFLVHVGLVEKKANEFHPVVSHIYLGRDAGMILKHHTNWRMKAIESLDKDSNEDLHLSVALSITHDDYIRIRENLAKEIQQTIERAKVSKEELLCAFNLDLFRMT